MSTHSILSPLPGTFYHKPAPDKAPFVTKGQQIAVGTTLGLIEVMKQYSPLTSDAEGVFIEFLIDDGDIVEVGQVVATIKTTEQ